MVAAHSSAQAHTPRPLLQTRTLFVSIKTKTNDQATTVNRIKQLLRLMQKPNNVSIVRSSERASTRQQQQQRQHWQRPACRLVPSKWKAAPSPPGCSPWRTGPSSLTATARPPGALCSPPPQEVWNFYRRYFSIHAAKKNKKTVTWCCMAVWLEMAAEMFKVIHWNANKHPIVQLWDLVAYSLGSCKVSR